MFTIDPFGMKHPEDRFCGQVAPEPMVSIHRRVELVFKSDIVSEGTNTGFLGKYKFVEESKSIRFSIALVRTFLRNQFS